MPVLYVTSKVRYPRVEYIAKRILPKEEITEYTNTTGILILNPEFSEICNGIDAFFELKHFKIKLFKRYISIVTYIYY